MKVLCLISTNNREPFKSILELGTIPTWVGGSTQIDVGVVFASIDNPIIAKLDSLRERMRYSNGGIARIGQLFDLLFAPLIFTVPKLKVISRGNFMKLSVRMPEMLSLYRWKYLAGIKYFLDNEEYDFLYNVNTSCFVSEKKLLEMLETFKDPIFAGSLIWDDKTQNFFASGANRIFSREIAQDIYRLRKFWAIHVLEDLALGRMTNEKGIPIHEIPTLNLTTAEEIEMLDVEKLNSNHHFRLKSILDSNKSSKSNRNDVELFLKLKERFDNLQ